MAPSCPHGQSCVAGGIGYTCQIGGGPLDAPIDQQPDAPATPADGPTPDGPLPDGPVALDTDGDTILDTVDNCPMRANVEQYNEDGDKYGDACDPCPPVADNNPPDADGDGVADACDPRPAIGGDSITRFEGFAAGVPTTGWFKTGTWTAAAGTITGDATGNKAMLTIAGPTTGHVTVRSSMTLVSTVASTDAAAGVVDAYDHVANVGVFCHLTTWGATNTPLAINEIAASGTVLDASSFDMVAGTTYALTERRDGTARSCDGSHAAVTANAGGTSAVSPAVPEIGLRAVHAKATYAWLMVVSNN